MALVGSGLAESQHTSDDCVKKTLSVSSGFLVWMDIHSIFLRSCLKHFIFLDQENLNLCGLFDYLCKTLLFLEKN